MVYAPQTQSGNFFNRQERDVRSYQLVEALSISKDGWAGQHVFKFGLDLQRSSFDGDDLQSRNRCRAPRRFARRADDLPRQRDRSWVSGTEFALFAQDRWRVNDRLNFELGLRLDRDDIVERVNYSPRVGMSVSILPEGRAILRGGFGKFAERTPLTVGAFTQDDTQTISRFGPDGSALGTPVTFRHVVGGELEDAESIVQTVAWDQRFGRRFFFKAAYLHREGSSGYILKPDRTLGLLTLMSTGASKYWEVETTGRFLASEHRDLSVSYVRAHGTGDLNDYDQFFGNFRNPIIRRNENSLSPTDVPNRLIVRGSIGFPGQWVFSPIYEWRTVSVVGGRRISGLRRDAQPDGQAADRHDARTSRWRGRGASRSIASPPASRSTTPSIPATSATFRATSRRPTTAASTIRSSVRLASSSATTKP